MAVAHYAAGASARWREDNPFGFVARKHEHDGGTFVVHRVLEAPSNVFDSPVVVGTLDDLLAWAERSEASMRMCSACAD